MDHLLADSQNYSSTLIQRKQFFSIPVSCRSGLIIDSTLLRLMNMNMKTFCLSLFTFFIVLLCVPSAHAQGGKLSTKNTRAANIYERATKYFDGKVYDVAMRDLLDCIKLDANFIEAHMLLGDTYAETKRYDEAIASYKKAIEINPDFFAGNYYNLGKIELKAGAYADARAHLQSYVSQPKIPESLRATASELMAHAAFADSCVKHPVPFDPINLGDSINTEHNEYTPTLTVDEQTLIITRRQPRSAQTIAMNKEEEDFYVSQKVKGVWSRALNMGPPINTGGNEGAQCISPDGKFLYYTACNRDDGFGSCDLYYARKTGDRWSSPKNMGPRVNSSSWESQPSISYDGNTLYFVSSRPGGQGKLDIWKTTRNESGLWSEPVNLGPNINTKMSEITPFIHPDDQTLYFSSDGHRGMGGLDLFYSRKSAEGEWAEPLNMGYPINTVGDENSMIINAAGNIAYYASDRPEGKGNLDLYSFVVYAAARPGVVSYVKGTVTDSQSGRGLEATLEVTDLATGMVVQTLTSDKAEGEYLIALPAGKDYMFNVSRTGYLFHSENFSLKQNNSVQQAFVVDVELQPVKAGNTVVMRNIFFDTDKFEMKEGSQTELKKLEMLMKENPAVKIEIAGHTDNVGDKKYNQTLSEKRAKSVFDALVASGADAARLTYKGYGDTKPMASNDNEEGRKQNRRTAFTILSDK